MKVLMVLLSLSFGLGIAHAQCPLNLDYVTHLPWDTSDCRSIRTAIQLQHCRVVLRAVFGLGLAQYLRDHSMFELPDNASAAACLKAYQQKLSSLGLASNVVQMCFNDTSKFVSSPSLCAGIQTKQDWIDKVGVTPLDTTCKGDMSSVSACGACYESALAVQKDLIDMINNITPETSEICHYFVCLYAAGVVNELGPFSTAVTSCIFRPPFLHKNSSHRRILFYSLTGVAICFLLLCTFWIGYRLRVRITDKDEHRRYVRMNRSILKRSVKPNTGAVWFDIYDIKHATQNFSDVNVIGQGSFGTVYKGTLPNGQQIAVKSIRDCTSEGDTKFINEVEIINKIKHRNLVVLRGFCVASDDEERCQRFLIYDYMANGNLDEHLHGGGNKNRAPLSWEQRRNIAIGTAKGLAYLHYGVQPAIYHRDIKATNILLDDQMNACVADFGLARMTVEGQSHLTTTRIAGTHGYLAPEYALYGQLTDRSDVYSFGVLLLEIMSGRKALDTSTGIGSDYLISDWAWKLVKEGKTMQVIDTRIRESGPDGVMERFVLLGILCAHLMVAFRPNIVEALKILEGDAEIPQIPDRPMPLTGHECIGDY